MVLADFLHSMRPLSIERDQIGEKEFQNFTKMTFDRINQMIQYRQRLIKERDAIDSVE